MLDQVQAGTFDWETPFRMIDEWGRRHGVTLTEISPQTSYQKSEVALQAVAERGEGHHVYVPAVAGFTGKHVRCAYMPQDRAYASEQFVRVEGFQDIIVCAGL